MAGLRHGRPGREPRGEGRPFLAGRVARDPGLRDRLTLARSLGISYKRLSGWEPATFYEYDDAGRLVSSRPEVEWDEDQSAWMLALAEHEASLCPRCGMPRDICQARETEGRVSVPAPSRCHVTTAILGAQKGYAENEHPTALIFGAHVATSTP